MEKWYDYCKNVEIVIILKIMLWYDFFQMENASSFSAEEASKNSGGEQRWPDTLLSKSIDWYSEEKLGIMGAPGGT